MTDRVLQGFLERQYDEGMALAEASDLLHLISLGGDPPRKYLADFRCTGLVKAPDGEIVPAERFVVGIWFPDDYLRAVDPFQILTWLEPRTVYHANVSDVGPFVCIGHIVPATSLVEILYRLFDVITYNKVTLVEEKALNREACGWGRSNVHRFPIDRRGLKRRTGAATGTDDFDVHPIKVAR